ncbi:hypothetical protein NDU88_008169 [Pleurodeles waltl]|uniref:Uncharacterized protein n=1 Tax=Pleurodeles waltl TaxID=8319 RepID=A0AAV7PRD3_PLEWA|nr:hypothetical protein NDU88_008169 [Pleurodeles waltl]
MVPPDPISTRSKLVQIEPTSQLLPQAQQQLVPSYNAVAGPQSVATAPMMNQAMGVNAPQGLGLGQSPAAISLPITVGPPVPLYAQVPPDLWLECKRGVDWPTEEPARDKVTGAPSEEVMKYYHKVIEFLKQKVLPKVTDWQKIDQTSQEAKESIHAYYERL